MATLIEASPVDRPVRTFAVRFPVRLQREIEAVASRDATNVSNTIRRLIAVGLRTEQQQDGHGR